MGITVMWYIWKAKNNYIFQYHPINPYCIKRKAISSILSMEITPIYAGLGCFDGAPTDWWLPPPPGWTKLNFDGAFNNFSQQARIGGVIRDSYGNKISTYSGEIRADQLPWSATFKCTSWRWLFSTDHNYPELWAPYLGHDGTLDESDTRSIIAKDQPTDWQISLPN